ILGNASQIERLLDGGYQGYLSLEPFAESVHALDDIPQAIAPSMTHLSRAVSQRH
ncbi:xylose isomerase, partial [Pseudomonas silesiensis]